MSTSRSLSTIYRIISVKEFQSTHSQSSSHAHDGSSYRPMRLSPFPPNIRGLSSYRQQSDRQADIHLQAKQYHDSLHLRFHSHYQWQLPHCKRKLDSTRSIHQSVGTCVKAQIHNTLYYHQHRDFATGRQSTLTQQEGERASDPATNPLVTNKDQLSSIPVTSSHRLTDMQPSSPHTASTSSDTMSHNTSTTRTSTTPNNNDNSVKLPSELPPNTYEWYKEYLIICIIFAITGSASVYLVKPLISALTGIQGSLLGGPNIYRILYILMLSPSYSVLLYIISTLAGRQRYFSRILRRMWGRLLPPSAVNRLFPSSVSSGATSGNIIRTADTSTPASSSSSPKKVT